MKILQWTCMPSPHQTPFHRALLAMGVDLQVAYYEQVDANRIALGWGAGENSQEYEKFVGKDINSLEAIPDWRERIHIIPGYRERFIRQFIKKFSQENVDWVHWTEPSHLGLRWWLTLPFKRWYAKIVNRHALGALAIGVRAVHDFRHWGIRPEKIVFVPYSVDSRDHNVSPDQVSEDFSQGRKIFLFLGQLCQRKATDLLLDAFAKISQQNKEWILLLVGTDSSSGGYAQKAKALGIHDQVLFRGAISLNQIDRVMKSAQVLLLPSRFDGWGATLSEGASAGLPLIGSEHAGSAWHLIEPGENGFRVKTGSVDSLAAAMQAYQNNSRLIETHASRSLEIYKNFTPEKNAQRFVNAIHSLKSLRKK